VRTLKFSSFDDGTPKGEYKRHKSKESGTENNDLNADTLLVAFKLSFKASPIEIKYFFDFFVLSRTES
jgi:hypothetical protein